MQLDSKWFIERVGKMIYRNKLNCKCKSCSDVERNWLVIMDKQHADVLYNTYCDYNAEWTYIIYSDTPVILPPQTK